MDVSDYRSLPAPIIDVLRKYRVIGVNRTRNPDGTVAEQEGWFQTNIVSPDPDSHDKTPLGPGPLLDPQVIERFLRADTTPNKAWLDWMLFQAGGGKDAQKRGEHLYNKSKLRFFEERKKGYTERGVSYPPMPIEKINKIWAANEARFKEDLRVGDQDLVLKHQIFGYFRHWPGKNRIYERLALAVNRFLKLAKKTKEMNTFYARQGDEDKIASGDAYDYATVDALEATIKRIERWHASKAARQDVQIETIYDDDYITALAPLTYAAAVQYGWDEWAWANRSKFNSALDSDRDDWQNAWKSTTGRDSSVFVYLQFKVPMPSWVAYSNERFTRHTLHNLALVIPHSAMRNFNPDAIKLFDEENNKNITLGSIKQQIQAEGSREYNPEEEEYPIHRGPRVYKDEAEALEVVKHLDACMDAVAEWAAHFDPKKIVSDFMRLG